VKGQDAYTPRWRVFGDSIESAVGWILARVLVPINGQDGQSFGGRRGAEWR